MKWSMKWRPVLGALAVMLFDCASLEPLATDTCGNGIVEANEDCDSLAEPRCGAPGAGAKACRLTCTPPREASATNNVTCEAGWGCGVDGICRRPEGTFSELGAALPAAAVTLRVGDFDGDGRADIVGGPHYGSVGGARVHYFGRDGRLESTTAIDIPLDLPVVRDLDGDKIDDIAFAARSSVVGGFAAVTGRSDRTFTPLALSSLAFASTQARATVINPGPAVRLPGDGACLLAAVQTPDGSFLRSVCAGDLVGLNLPRYEVAVDFKPTDLMVRDEPLLRAAALYPAGEPAAGAPACGIIAAAFNVGDSGRLTIATPCVYERDRPVKPGDLGVRFNVVWNNGVPRPPSFSFPGRIDELLVTDSDNDGSEEIVVHVSAAVGAGTYYLYSKDTPEPKALPEFLPAAGLRQSDGQRVLATADLDGDGRGDAITSHWVKVTRSIRVADGGAVDGGLLVEGWPSVAEPRNRGRWADAVVGHFNGDELLDVVLRSDNGRDLDILLNAGDGRFTPFTLRTDLPVRAIASGDFDGDTIDDLAFLQSTADFSQPNVESDLLIAFGQQTGGPTTPRVMGRFLNARALLPLAGTRAAVNDLVIAEEVTSGAAIETRLTALVGSSARQPTSPLFINDLNASITGPRTPLGRLWAPASFSIGQVEPGGPIDIIAIASGLPVPAPGENVRGVAIPTSAWRAQFDPATRKVVPFIEGQSLTNAIEGLDRRAVNEGIFQVSVVTVVGNINAIADASDDEVVSIGRSPAGETGIFIIDDRPGAEPKARFVIAGARVDGADPCALADIDDDGYRDLVAILSFESGATRRVVVFLNDKNGGFNPTPIEIVPDEKAPVAFAALRAGDGAAVRTQLAIVTERALFRARLNDDKRAFTITPVRELSAAKETRLTAVVAGDIDGDGVDDLVVADRGELRVLRQLPRLP